MCSAQRVYPVRHVQWGESVFWTLLYEWEWAALYSIVTYLLFLNRCAPNSIFIPGTQTSSNFNTSGSGQTGRHFANGIFKCLFFILIFIFWIIFHWSLIPRVRMTISKRSDDGLAPNRWHAITRTNDEQDHRGPAITFQSFNSLARGHLDAILK